MPEKKVCSEFGKTLTDNKIIITTFNQSIHGQNKSEIKNLNRAWRSRNTESNRKIIKIAGG